MQDIALDLEETNTSGPAFIDEDDNSSVEFSDVSDNELHIANDHSVEPSWAKVLPAHFSMGRKEERLNERHDKASFRNQIYDECSALDPASAGAASIGTGPCFRLLQIRPDVYDQPIMCDLVVRPVFDAPTYVALSYSWGSAPVSHEIFIGAKGTPFAVSAHLWAAFRRLRHEQQVVRLWVDAVCIDQQNLLEKASQVHIMAQIYNQASEVVIWLGAVEYFRRKELTDVKLFQSLCKQASPWWKRLWVVQECAYARNCPVVMFGLLTMSLESLVHRWTAAVDVLHDDVYAATQLKGNLGQLRVPYNAWKAQAETNIHRLPLLLRLRETVNRQCTVPHDRIYAVLNLIDEDEAKQISPDYRKSWTRLKYEVRNLIKQCPEWDPLQDERLLDSVFAQGVKLEDVGNAVYEGDIGFARDLLRSFTKDIDALIEALQSASSSGQEEYVELLLHSEGLRNSPKDLFITALQRASENGHEQVARLLLQAGAKVDAWRHSDGDALQKASQNGHEKVVLLLLDAGANVNALRHSYGNALQRASENGHERVVRILLDAGANVNLRGGSYGTALHRAAENGHDEVVRQLLDAGADIDSRGDGKSTALQIASEYGHDRVVSVLLDAGADIDACENQHDSALRRALVHGHEHVLSLLLDAGADFNVHGDGCSGMLRTASLHGFEGMVRELLAAGADVNAKDKHGSALQAASFHGYERVVRILIDGGADVNAHNDNGNALQSASSRGYESIVRMLIDAGADVNAPDDHGNALQAASFHGYEEIVRMLIDAGADLDASNKYHGTALQAASLNGHDKVKQLLIDAGASLEHQGQSE